MEKIITYVAFDGTQFDDEDECVEHEFLENAKEYADRLAATAVAISIMTNFFFIINNHTFL